MTRVLGIISRTPYGSTRVLEGLEALMVAAAFDQDTRVLFRGEGVLNLIDHQDGQALGVRSISKIVKALSTYEIDHVYACELSLETYGLEEADLAIDVKRMDQDAQRDLLQAQDAVMGI